METTNEPATGYTLDRQGYPYRFGSLASAARSYMLGLITRDQFAEAVNEAHDSRYFTPIPLDGTETYLPLLNLRTPAEIAYDRDSTEDDARRDDDHEYHPGRDLDPEGK